MFGFRESFVRIGALASLALLCAASARAQEKVTLRLNLQKGQSYEQVISMLQKISYFSENQRANVTTQTRFGLHMEVLEKSSDGALLIKITYQSAQMESQTKVISSLTRDEIFAIKYNISALSLERLELLQKYRDDTPEVKFVDDQLQALRAILNGTSAEFENAQSQATSDSRIRDEMITIKSQLTSLRLTRLELLQKYRDDTPELKAIDDQIRSWRAMLNEAGTDLKNKEFVLRYYSSRPNAKAAAKTEVLAALVGQSVVVHVSRRGEVFKIEGLNELKQRIVSSAPVPEAQRAEMRKVIEKIMDSQTSQVMGLAFFSASPVAVSDSWQTQNPPSTNVPVSLDTRYTLATLADDVAVLNVRAKISNTKTSSDFSGAQNGVMRVDEITGLPRSFELHQRISGQAATTKLNNSEASAPIPLHIESTVRGWTTAPPR